LFAGNAFDLYTLEEVLKLSTVTVGADISTVAGATNEIVTRTREENGRPDRNLAFRTPKDTCLQHALPPGRRSGIFGRGALTAVFHKLAVRNVFVAVAFELHLSDDVVQQIAGGVSISSQKMVAADTFTTIDLTADALAARVRSAIVSVRPEGSAAICAVQ
jgi:hypothetical protein